MSIKNQKIDQYISKAEPFAKPILEHLRKLVHQACPEVEETIKWSFPHFDYKGGMCSMASFKKHCAFTFWKASLIHDPQNFLEKEERNAMGHFGQIKCIEDLPDDKTIIAYIKQAMELNDKGIKLPAKEKSTSKMIEIPVYFLKALKQNKKALDVFEKASYSFKKEYVQWVTGAKAETTRDSRITQAIKWIAEGKGKNWKYEK